LETPASPLQGPADQLQGPASSLQAPASPLQGAASSLQAPASPSRLRLSAYRAESSMEQRFMAAQVAIETVLADTQLQDALAPYGYDTTHMLQGQALRALALALVQQQRASVGDQFAAIDSRAKSQAQAHTVYMRHVALARIALRDDRGATQKLDLSARKRTQAGWVLQAQQFYTNALAEPAIITKLARYSVTYAQLLAAQALVGEVATGIVTQQSRKGIAKESKQARDAALQALNRWMRDFMAVARIALADQPQRLAQLGVTGG
jgi:hypothetical protein